MTDRFPLVWRKSSHSTSGGNCVELAYLWRKSSHSTSGGSCVELAYLRDRIAVRDSKAPDAGTLVLPDTGLTALLCAVRSGQLT